MADEPVPAKKRRRLRATTETIREKSAKAQAASTANKPTKRRRAAKVAATPFRGLAWLGHKPPLKQIGHGFRWFAHLRPVRFIGRLLGFRYVRDSWLELKAVSWPTRKQSFRLTGAVIVFSVIFGAVIAITDYGLDKLFKQVILK